MPVATATPPTRVMKSPDSGSTANTASLSGNKFRAVTDQDAPPRAPTPASTPPRPTTQVSPADTRARRSGDASTPTTREVAAATATSSSPALTRLIGPGSSTTQTPQCGDDGLGLRRTPCDRDVDRNEVANASLHPVGPGEDSAVAGAVA